MAKGNAKFTWPLVQGWGIAVRVLPPCLHPEASVWVVFAMACRLCGYKIVLVSTTAKSVPAIQLPSHTSLNVGIPLHIKPGRGGLLKKMVLLSKVLNKVRSNLSEIRVPNPRPVLQYPSHRCSPAATPSLQGHCAKEMQQPQPAQALIFCTAFQLYVLTCDEILSLLLLKPYTSM